MSKAILLALAACAIMAQAGCTSRATDGGVVTVFSAHGQEAPRKWTPGCSSSFTRAQYYAAEVAEFWALYESAFEAFTAGNATLSGCGAAWTVTWTQDGKQHTMRVLDR